MGKWYNMYAILDSLTSISYPRLTLYSKTKPFTAAHAKTAHIWPPPPTQPHIIRKHTLFEQKSTSGKRKTKSKTVSQFCPDIHILDSYPTSFIKNYYLREFDKKSLKHCPSGDHLINFHNLSPRLSNEIVWRKFMLLTWGLNGLRWNAFVHQTIL